MLMHRVALLFPPPSPPNDRYLVSVLKHNPALQASKQQAYSVFPVPWRVRTERHAGGLKVDKLMVCVCYYTQSVIIQYQGCWYRLHHHSRASFVGAWLVLEYIDSHDYPKTYWGQVHNKAYLFIAHWQLSDRTKRRLFYFIEQRRN
jgi:hypothetical protein